MLVVGPNRVFLDYISHVLPSLGERAVQQRTIGDLATPSVTVEGIDDDAISRIKGDARMALVIERAAVTAVTVAKETLRVGVGSRSIVVTPELVQGWVDAALASRQPLNRRRQAFRALALQELARGAPGGEDQVRANAPLKTLLDRTWPVVKARALIERILGNADALAAAAHGILDPAEQALIVRRRKRWTTADLPLLDEATGVVEGPPATYGHIVVDEAQDLSAMGLMPLGFVHGARRSRAVHRPRRPHPLVRRRRATRARGRCLDRTAHDRLPRARPDPRDGQPSVARYRRGCGRQPFRATRG